MSDDDRDVLSWAYKKPIYGFSYFSGAICFQFIEEIYKKTSNLVQKRQEKLLLMIFFAEKYLGVGVSGH